MRKLKKCIGLHFISTRKSFVFFLMLVTIGSFATSFGIEAYMEVFKTDITVNKLEKIEPKEPVVIDFSIAVFQEYYNSKIRIIPEENFKLRWEKSNKRLSVVPENFWKPDMEYRIILPQGENIMLSPVSEKTISFFTKKYPEVESVIPENEAEGAMIDIEDPIVVNFRQATSGFFIKFILNSGSDLSIQNNPEKTQFRLMPKKEIKYSTRYDLKIYAKYVNDDEDDYRQIFESSFATLPMPKIIWNRDLGERISQAKKYADARIKSGKYIDINLEAQIMSIFEEGEILDAYIISSGKRGMETPKGSSRIYNKSPRAYSKDYGLYMPYWMALAESGKFGIHELPEWPNGYKEGAAHLGIPVSHGCVRLGIGAAKRIYEWAEIGTPVEIH